MKRKQLPVTSGIKRSDFRVAAVVRLRTSLGLDHAQVGLQEPRSEGRAGQFVASYIGDSEVVRSFIG
jgi:hypothetical protein